MSTNISGSERGDDLKIDEELAIRFWPSLPTRVGSPQVDMSSSPSASYALGERARCVAAVAGDGDQPVFAVGTQRLKGNNSVHFIEHDRSRNALVKRGSYKHHPEIWDLQPSPTDATLIATMYNPLSVTPDYGGAVWRVPGGGDDQNESKDGSLESVASFNGLTGAARCVRWKVGVGCDPNGPSTSGTLVTLDENSLKLWELDASPSTTMAVTSSSNLESVDCKSPTSGAWDPHARDLFAVVVGDGVSIFDLRSMTRSTSLIRPHKQNTLNVSYDGKNQHKVVTCGGDGFVKVFDLRNPKSALATKSGHEHAVFHVECNPVYDLLVSCSADGTCKLWRDDFLGAESDAKTNTKRTLSNGGSENNSNSVNSLVATYGESSRLNTVYGVAWSKADPWSFLQLRDDGAVTLNTVPRAEKYRILL